jgi:hypothetical protein
MPLTLPAGLPAAPEETIMAVTFEATNAGLNLLRDATIGANNANAQVQYLALGTGITTIASPLTSGVNYTSFIPAAPLTVNIPAGTLLTLVNGTHMQTVVCTGNHIGDTGIGVNLFTANYSYPTGSGIVANPQGSDTQLQNEIYRAPISSANPGANVGEGIVNLYVGASDVGSAETFLEAGIFTGTPTGTPNSGTLLARAVIWFAYTPGSSAALVQFDYTLASA